MIYMCVNDPIHNESVCAYIYLIKWQPVWFDRHYAPSLYGLYSSYIVCSPAVLRVVSRRFCWLDIPLSSMENWRGCRLMSLRGGQDQHPQDPENLIHLHSLEEERERKIWWGGGSQHCLSMTSPQWTIQQSEKRPNTHTHTHRAYYQAQFQYILWCLICF